MASTPGPWRATVVAALALTVLAAGLLALVRPWADDGDRPDASGEFRASVFIEQLADLSGPVPASGFGDRAGATPQARAWAQQAWANLEALGADTVSFRHVRSVGERPDGLRQVDVVVAWSSGPGGLDARFPPATVGLLLAFDGERYAIEGVVPVVDPVPVWLVGDLQVSTDGPATLIAIDATPSDTDRLADRVVTAAEHVRTHLDVAEPRVVVVAPRDAEQAAIVLGRPADELAPIAALTTRLGSGVAGTEVSGITAVLLNPPVFEAMDDRGADVVLAHEAVHAMTDSIGRDLEPWATEGFADYIALLDDERPAEAIAADYLDRIRAAGPPTALPSAQDFAADAERLGSVYEGAWLVVHSLALAYGHDAVVAFYEELLAGVSLDEALADVFGTTLDAVTSAWITVVTELAQD